MEAFIKQWFSNKIISSSCIKKFINSHPDVKNWLEDKLLIEPEFEKNSYLVISIIKDIKLKNCECGKKMKYTSVIRNNEFCSIKCMANSNKIKQKRINSCLNKYGVEHSSMSKEVRDKNKKTNIERYGVEHPAQSILVQNKSKKTNLEKYGVDCPFKLKNVKDKIIKTNIEKYGVENVLESERIKDKIKNTNFEKYGVEYVQQNKDVRKKTIDTNIERYGFENPFQSEQIKEKIIKSCLDKFGVEHPLQCVNVQNKIKNTNIKRYGVENTFQSEDKKQIIKQTMMQRYGVENPLQSEFFQEKRKKTLYRLIYKRFSRWHNYVVPLFSEDEYNGIMSSNKWKCVKCGNEFEQKIHTTYHVKEFATLPRCLKCFPYVDGFSLLEREVSGFIKQYFVDVIENDRSIISPLELDIVIPSKKITIEFNGLYWHSENQGKDKNYHINKTILCENKGYKLIHIFEDEWSNKQEIIKAKLKSILGIKQEQDRIFARKCIVRQVETKEKNIFLEKTHLQGADKSSVKIGLFANDILVAIMTFGKSRFDKKYIWELVRYSTCKNVIGGASKLLSYFEKQFNPKSIITYADRRFSKGNMYEKIGFKFDHFSEPNYWWTKGLVKLSRYECQKHLLKNILKEKYDSNLSESENMMLNGYDRIYDCGNLVYIKYRL